jgi:hypothetical protein
VIRRAVPLALALISISNPQLNILDTLRSDFNIYPTLLPHLLNKYNVRGLFIVLMIGLLCSISDPFLIQMRIQHFKLNTGPDPDPGF